MFFTNKGSCDVGGLSSLSRQKQEPVWDQGETGLFS